MKEDSKRVRLLPIDNTKMNLEFEGSLVANLRPFNNGKLDRGKNIPMRNFREMVTRKK